MSNDKQTFRLYCDASGNWIYESADGVQYEHAHVVRAFPISAPDHGFSIVSADGHELLWIERIEALPPEQQQQVKDALASREFMPEIQQIMRVSSTTAPSVWAVKTDRGETAFTLSGEENIRRLTGSMLLIDDSHGIHYLIRDVTLLDKQSRRLLDHFM